MSTNDAPESAGHTAVFDVLLTRTQQAHILVQAASKEEAFDDAEQLVDEKDWLDADDDSEIDRTIDNPTERYWSGGPDGQWVEP